MAFWQELGWDGLCSQEKKKKKNKTRKSAERATEHWGFHSVFSVTCGRVNEWPKNI